MLACNWVISLHRSFIFPIIHRSAAADLTKKKRPWNVHKAQKEARQWPQLLPIPLAVAMTLS